jgi:hypothetical protein
MRQTWSTTSRSNSMAGKASPMRGGRQYSISEYFCSPVECGHAFAVSDPT